ncbi:MAG: hypothetical protein PVI39_11740 [Desulfobacteraceae bacterium]|jgi:hypothetical protein
MLEILALRKQAPIFQYPAFGFWQSAKEENLKQAKVAKEKTVADHQRRFNLAEEPLSQIDGFEENSKSDDIKSPKIRRRAQLAKRGALIHAAATLR